MEGHTNKTPLDIERDILSFPNFPLALGEEFSKAKEPMRRLLDEEQFLSWAQEGFDIARQAVRSWEAACEYFKVSADMLGAFQPSRLISWAQVGSSLCRESPSLAVSYFKASPEAVVHLEPHRVSDWARLGLSLYKGTWKSSVLSSKFFETSTGLLQLLTFQEMQRLVALLDKLSQHSYDMANDCLDLSPAVFANLGSAKDVFLSLATNMMSTSWRDSKSLFEAGARSLSRLDRGQRARFLNLTMNLMKDGDHKIPVFILESTEAMSQLDPASHALVLSLCESLLVQSPAAVGDFIKNTPTILGRVSVSQFEEWFSEGLKVMKENQDGGLAYFKIESSWSEHILDALSSTVDLDRVKEIIRMYCRALAGAELEIAPSQELVDKHIGWVSNERPTTEGKTVYLPPSIDRYNSKEANFSWIKVVSTHQVGHLEFDSFGFIFQKPSLLFDDLRFKFPAAKQTNSPSPDNNGSDTAERGWITDMQHLFDLFEDRKLALDIFTIVEDGRLDSRIKHEYRGIRKAYEKIQMDSLSERPDIRSLPAREALVEFLVRLSLQQYKGIPAPESLVEQARTIAAIAKRVLSPEATVQDSAEATIRIYAILSQVPNTEQPPEKWEDMDLDQEEDYKDPEDMEQLLDQMSRSMSQDPEESEEEQEYESPQDVEFRGDFKPELVQLLSALKMQQNDKSVEPQELSKEMLEELLRQSAELDLQPEHGDTEATVTLFADNLVKEAGMSKPQTPESGHGATLNFNEDGGSLEVSEPLSYLYDEWDFRAEDYKPRWCVVRQKVMAEGDLTFYSETLRNYSSMVSEIRRQFEMVIPEMFRKVYRLPDGEEFDLDAVIEAKVDAKTGNSPSEKLYWKRNKIHRDVAVLFLLDLSASTAEAIEDSKHLPDDWDTPDDPAEYMAWLRNRRSQGVRRAHKRIVDIEKESAVLLINALEIIGDTYGIYGFSGYGRENVEFYVIKDIEEKFSDKVKRRIDRIAPLHATRMGPAIRHAISKLENQPAKTKLLFLISDGRPQDRGYSREGVEKEYAVHDTRMALVEARRKEITPFCLTVDKSGHDYLKTMCHDMGYEVLADIYALPKRLPLLYRKLTG